MENEITKLQKTLGTILTNMQEEQQRQEKMETSNIKLLKVLINTSKKYNTREMKTEYGTINTKQKFECLYRIIVEQNKRIHKLEEKLNIQ